MDSVSTFQRPEPVFVAPRLPTLCIPEPYTNHGTTDAITATDTVGPLRILDFPTELLIKICARTIIIDTRTGSSLLLVNRKLHDVTLLAYQQAALEHTEEQHPIAAILFERRPNDNPYFEWLPRIFARSTQIQKMLLLARRSRFAYWEGNNRDILKPLTNKDAIRVLDIGLHLIGMIHFKHDSNPAPAVIHAFIDSLPAPALLALRATSILMTTLFRHHYTRHHGQRDLLAAVKLASRYQPGSGLEWTTQVFEKLLIAHGFASSEYILDKWPALKHGSFDPFVADLAAIVRNIDYLDRISKSQPVTMNMKRVRYDIKVSESIAAAFPDEAGMLSQEWENINRMAAEVGEWMGERSALEVLRELKELVVVG